MKKLTEISEVEFAINEKNLQFKVFIVVNGKLIYNVKLKEKNINLN